MYKRDWLGHASRFFNEHVADLDTLAPHNGLSDSGTYCLADPGREYVVHSKNGASTTFNLDMSADSGVFDCRFYNPQNGQFESTFQRQGGGTESFTKPNYDDWVLHIVISPHTPVAVISTTPDPAEGVVPLTVIFDGSGSYDNDSQGDPPQIVSYEWDFTDDGTYDENNASSSTSYEYATTATYTCRLRVTDNEGMTDEATVEITVENAPGDFDGDRDVDQEDFGFLQTCFSAPGLPIDPGCEDADLNDDDAVDQNDFGIFQGCMSGANIPAEPDCAD
jgi:PKD repeat protein